MTRILTAALTLFLFAAIADAATTVEQRRASHVLNRLAFGPRPGDMEKVLEVGVDRWIEQQLRPERISDAAVDTRLQSFETLQMSEAEIVREFYQPIVEARRMERADEGEKTALRDLQKESRRVVAELASQRILRAAHSERQLNEIMVEFWMNHFNVFAGKGIDRFLLTAFERDTIRPHVWGCFEDLVLATAKSPAMLFYLDNAKSRREGINENYARELMELHTLGVDGGYKQKDVTELARILTGWSIARPREGSGFLFRRKQHDRQPKQLLGLRVAAGGGVEEGERAIRYLANHPSTARHIAWKLAQKFVSDEPPPALVDRVAKRFLETGGNLRETVKAVITSPEFNDPAHFNVKVKSPFEYVVSAMRALDAKIVHSRGIMAQLRALGQPLYFSEPPTGYAEEAEAWVSSGAVMNRLNFAMELSANRIPGVRVKVPGDPMKVPGVNLSAATLETIRKREAAEPALVTGLVLGSPEFQRQ